MRSLAPAIRPYQMSWLRADILAGLAAGAVVIPQAMAYATVANMPVQIGVYTTPTCTAHTARDVLRARLTSGRSVEKAPEAGWAQR